MVQKKLWQFIYLICIIAVPLLLPSCSGDSVEENELDINAEFNPITLDGKTYYCADNSFTPSSPKDYYEDYTLWNRVYFHVNIYPSKDYFSEPYELSFIYYKSSDPSSLSGSYDVSKYFSVRNFNRSLSIVMDSYGYDESGTINVISNDGETIILEFDNFSFTKYDETHTINGKIIFDGPYTTN